MGVNRPAIVRTIPHFAPFPTFCACFGCANQSMSAQPHSGCSRWKSELVWQMLEKIRRVEGSGPHFFQSMLTAIGTYFVGINLFPLIPACTGRPGLPLLPASSARPGLPLSAPANGFDDERHRQSPSHHSFESVIYT